MARKLKPEKVDRVHEPVPMERASSATSAKGEVDERQILLIARAIADPRRMSLLRAIAQKTTSCAELRCGQTIGAATLSHHLRELENAGLIATTKQGRSVHATLQKKVWKNYVSALKALAD